MSDQERCPTDAIDNLRDARRYRRLRVLGCAPMNTKQLDNGTVLRFTGLDDHIDEDMRVVASRGEVGHDSAPSSVAEQPQPTCHSADYRVGESHEHARVKTGSNQESGASADESQNVQSVRQEGRCEGSSSGQLDEGSDMSVLQTRGRAVAEQPSREQAVEGLVIDIETARLINGAFLPTNPNKMRSACPEVIQAAKKFKDALAHYEASRGERQ